LGRGAWALAVALSFSVVPALARGRVEDDGAVRVGVDGPARLLTNTDGSTSEAIEASGVAVLGDGTQVLVADDRTSALLVVETATGRIVGRPISAPGFPEDGDSKRRPKWEALARDDAGRFYAIGSHSGTDEEKRARAYLLRFRMAGTGTEVDPWRIDETSVRRWHVADALVELLRGEGLGDAALEARKVEGLTVRTHRGVDGRVERRELVIGLREPGDKVRVARVDITDEPPTGAALRLEPLFAFEAGAREGTGLQLGSLEHVDLLGETGFAVVTTTEDADNRFHGNVLWFVPDDRLGSPRVLWEFEPEMKAEGIDALPATGAGEARFVVVYDNDPNKTQIPSRIQTITIRE
jgi:hypothetical protein